jgi:hypothetical protein
MPRSSPRKSFRPRREALIPEPDVAVTMELYTKVVTALKRDAANRIDDALREMER